MIFEHEIVKPLPMSRQHMLNMMQQLNRIRLSNLYNPDMYDGSTNLGDGSTNLGEASLNMDKDVEDLAISQPSQEDNRIVADIVQRLVSETTTSPPLPRVARRRHYAELIRGHTSFMPVSSSIRQALEAARIV